MTGAVRQAPLIREMRPEDARAFLEVHHAAVRGLAAGHYPAEVIEHWAPLPVTDADVERFRANPDGEVRLVAELDGAIAGVGALVVSASELRACYVAPQAARRGVGSALVRALERAARAHGLRHLQLDASLNAEQFYRAQGYEVRQRGEHIRTSGARMACVKMRKALA